MKSHIVLILTFLFPLHIIAQPDWQELPIENSVWRQYTASWYYGDIGIQSTATYTFGGDTLINGVNFKKIIEDFNPNWYVGALRQEEKRVLFIKNQYTTLDTLYDFNIEIGTIIHTIEDYYGENWCEEYGGDWACPYIKLIEIDTSGERDKFNFGFFNQYDPGEETLIFPPFKWIEGIGSTQGLFNEVEYLYDLWWIHSDEYEYYSGLLCMSTEDTLVYTGPYYNDNCFYTSTSLEEKLPNDEKELIFYPNPALDKLFIKTNVQNSPKSPFIINTYDISGKIIDHQQFNEPLPDPHLEISVHNYPSGTYLLSIVSPEITKSYLFVKK